ncbi:MAG: VanZ family protein [Gemmatirosa sp.]|nr:VanZ family protein [Gemmatirosa sp.]
MVALIAFLTLRPVAAVSYETFGHLCILCGSIGGADFVANVLLFVPLGAALVLAGLSWRRAALLGAAFSLGIETAQWLVIAGRFATLSDVLTNSTGTLVGATIATWRHEWLRPRRRVATWLAAAAAAGWLGVFGFSTWALGRVPDASGEPPRISARTTTPGFGWFGGHVERATVKDLTVDHRGTGPVIIQAPLGQAVQARVEGRGSQFRHELVPMLFVHAPGDTVPRLLIGQRGGDVVFRVALRASQLRLRSPDVSVRRVLLGRFERDIRYSIDALAAGDSLSVDFKLTDRSQLPDRLWRRWGGPQRNVLHLKPTHGWSLLSPIPGLDSPLAPFATAAWLVGLTLPLGYWSTWATWGPPVSRRRAGRRTVLAVAGAVVAIGIALAVFPPLGGFPRSGWREWSAALGGAALGALVAMAVRRRRA